MFARITAAILSAWMVLPACAGALAVTNPAFESAPTARADGAITATLATGWTFTNLSGSTGTFTFNPAPSGRYYNGPEFADTSATGGARGTMSGPNFTGLSGNGSGQIQQTLGATLQENTRYTLTASLGHRTVDSGAAATASPVTFELLAGGVSLGTATFDPASGIWSDAGALEDDVWADASLIVTTAAAPPQAGQALTVRFIKSGASGNYMDLDNIRLDAVPVVTPPPVALHAGMVAYFPFEEDFENRGGAVDGTGMQGARAGRPGGVAGNAMELRPEGAASNDHMHAAIGYGGTTGEGNLGANFTLSAWYRLDQPPSGSGSGRYFVFEGDASTGQGFEVSYGLRDLGLGTAGTNDGQVFTETSGTSSINVADAGTAGWHHVLQTYSSNGAVTTITTYIDGVATASLTAQTSAVVDGGLNFGAARAAVTDRGFDGMIDEVGLWSRVLNGSEIQQVRSLGLSGSPLVSPPVITSFTSSAGQAAPGSAVTLSWQVTGAETISISPDIGTVSASGSVQVTVDAPVTYTLTATAADGSTDRARVDIRINNGPIDVYLLGGQSNMQGVGQKAKLPPLGLAEIPELFLYHSSGTISTVGANKLMTVRANGFDAATFGPEIGFADAMRNLRRGRPACLIKHAAGGTSLQVKWKPGANNADTGNFGAEYSTFVSTVNAGLAALRAQGYQPVIRGMLWQQGEQDSKAGINTGGDGTASSAAEYGANLKHFVARVREQFAADIAPEGMRFVLGQTSPYYPVGGSLRTDYPARDQIRQAQLEADENSGAALSIPNTGTVPTNDVEFPVHEQEIDGYRDDDEAHLNAAAQLLLGRRMAYRMLGLAPLSYGDWASGWNVAGGSEEDDDDDGVSNFLEYVGGTDPGDAASARHPEIHLQQQSGKRYLVFTLTRSLNTLGITPRAEMSPDLIHWNTGITPEFTGAAYPSPGMARWSFRSPLPVDASAPRMFMRMAVDP